MPEQPRRCEVCDRPGPFPSLYVRGGFVLVQCAECGLIFQDPLPSPEAMASLYYHGDELAGLLETDLRAFALGRAREKRLLLEDAGVASGGRALDVGCSTGAWLEVAGKAGWRPVGVELGDAFAQAARRRGLEVHTGTLADYVRAAEPAKFDLITFWDVLEHLPEPRAALEQALGLLAPGGTVAVTFPNVAGLYPRATLRLIAGPTGVWEHPELPAHLYDFSPSTATALLRRAGLEPISMRTTNVPFFYYRSTALAHQLAGRGWKGRAIRLAFEALHAVLYPAATAMDRGNALFAVAERRGLGE